MRRPFTLGMLTVLLILSPAVVWLMWAENEYRGLDSCPWDSDLGHSLLVGLVLMVPPAAIMTWRLSKKGAVVAVCSGVAAGLLAGLVIGVVALFFGAGLRCMD